LAWSRACGAVSQSSRRMSSRRQFDTRHFVLPQVLLGALREALRSEVRVHMRSALLFLGTVLRLPCRR
jgi:hypothetical protein